MRRIIGDDLAIDQFFIALHDNDSLRDTSVALTDRISPSLWFTRAHRAGVQSLRNVRPLPFVLVALLGNGCCSVGAPARHDLACGAS